MPNASLLILFHVNKPVGITIQIGYFTCRNQRCSLIAGCLRWQMSRKAIIGPLTKNDVSKLKPGMKALKSSSSHELSELDIESDVENLDLHEQKERSPNARGLKTLAKIFNKDRGSVSDTPTIFALLRASHIVSKCFKFFSSFELRSFVFLL